jgi:hypothetical protein
MRQTLHLHWAFSAPEKPEFIYTVPERSSGEKKKKKKCIELASTTEPLLAFTARHFASLILRRIRHTTNAPNPTGLMAKSCAPAARHQATARDQGYATADDGKMGMAAPRSQGGYQRLKLLLIHLNACRIEKKFYCSSTTTSAHLWARLANGFVPCALESHGNARRRFLQLNNNIEVPVLPVVLHSFVSSITGLDCPACRPHPTDSVCPTCFFLVGAFGSLHKRGPTSCTHPGVWHY